jgi:tRNA (guanine10-N2)-dimethyltransferase
VALLIELSGEQLDLARAEALAAASSLEGRDAAPLLIDGPALVIDAPGVTAKALAGRLGLAHAVMEGASSGAVEEAVALAAALDLGRARTFRVRARRAVAPEGSPQGPRGFEVEAKAGEAILASHPGMRVDLQRPEAEVRLVLAAGAHAGVLGGTVDRRAMEARASSHRPFTQPISIHPKYARAMVNLARIAPGGRVVDPFCGTGGILIESALMGHASAGSDLDASMVSGTRRNLDFLGLSAHLARCDVGEFPSALGPPVDGVVTDPPYGKSTWTDGEEPADVVWRLYDACAAALDKGRRVVVCLHSADLLPKAGTGLIVESIYPLRVHRSLTRHIAVLRRS